jgi:TPR repeat protein
MRCVDSEKPTITASSASRKAIIRLALAYGHGELCFEGDEDRTFERIRKAAGGGNADAQCILEEDYEYGEFGRRRRRRYVAATR